MGSPNPEPGTGPATDALLASAQGWQRLQLAVLGFIGLCGVLWAGGDHAGPSWLQWLAGALALAALALACVALYLVGTIAYPLRGAGRSLEPAARTRRLRAGVWLTYLAGIVLVVATLAGWWPSADTEEAGLVEVSDVTGTTRCGELGAGLPGTIRLDTAGGPVAIPLESVATLEPATSCG